MKHVITGECLQAQSDAIQEAVDLFGTQARLADEIAKHKQGKCNQSYIHQWKEGLARVSPDAAVWIEMATNGKVKRERFNSWIYDGFERKPVARFKKGR